ncbi:MAG: cytochrome c [Pseudomonadota bacterium]
MRAEALKGAAGRSMKAALVAGGLLSLGLALPAMAEESQADLVKRGEQLTIAGDCVSCHTAPNGKEFAGGLEMNTPFGTLSTPNITPDKKTGLGEWTESDFYTAMHKGIRRDGAYLYPVFPYTSFTKVREADVKAIWAYLQSLEPIDAPRKSSDMSFPFNIRAGLLVWRQLYFDQGTFRPDPSWSDEVARGAYLVEGLGHCGECHSPRDALGGTETDDSLAGGDVDSWFAPNISASLSSGIGGWSKEEVVHYLRTGAAKGKGTVFGPMQEVVHNSLSKLPDGDIEAIAAYLKVTPARNEAVDNQPDLDKRAGGLVYLNNCVACHQSNGDGIKGAIPNLAGNEAILGPQSDNVISVVLGGLPGGGSYGAMPSFAGKLSDQEVADVANYVRNNWGNFAPANATADLAASIRAKLNVPGADGSARPTAAFECPVPGNLDIKPPTLNLMKHATPAEVGNRVGIILAQIRRNHPNIGSAELVDSVAAAYCPILADDTSIDDESRHQFLASFIAKLQSQIAKETLPPGARILVQVPFNPEVLSKIEAAAQAAKESRADWIEKAAESQLTTQQ